MEWEWKMVKLKTFTKEIKIHQKLKKKTFQLL